MEKLYNLFSNDIFFQFLGAIISIALTVSVIHIKREIERSKRRNYYEGINQNAQILGDIDIKINEELPNENFLKLLTMWGLQPLLLLILISFVDNHNNQFKILWFSTLLIFTLFHEFHSGLKYSSKWKYQLFMLVVWIISFFLLSYEKNLSQKKAIIEESVQQHHTTAAMTNC